MLGHKTSLSKFKKTEVISCMFSYHNAMGVEINDKRETAKTLNRWKLSNMLLQPMDHCKNRKFKNIWKQMKVKAQ